MSFSSEDTSCPLCTEELDITDIHFKPCPCGYQMCRFCWNSIMDQNQKCPACRAVYDPKNYDFAPPDEQQIAKHKSKRKKEKKAKQSEKEVINRKSLINIRVIQRNLVYITNLALSIAKEEYLRKYEYFGQYGKIGKIVINKNNLYSVNSPHGPSVSAYITFVSKKDAMACISAIDGFWIENRALRASFGTTKYCTYFLRNLPCNNPDCMYLHELGGEEDSFTKEEIASGKHNFQDQDQDEGYTDDFDHQRPTILPQRSTPPEIPNDEMENNGTEPPPSSPSPPPPLTGKENGNEDSSLDGLPNFISPSPSPTPTPSSAPSSVDGSANKYISKNNSSPWKTSSTLSLSTQEDQNTDGNGNAPDWGNNGPSTPLKVEENNNAPSSSSSTWSVKAKPKPNLLSSSSSSMIPQSAWGAPPGLRRSGTIDTTGVSESTGSGESSSLPVAVIDSFPDLRAVYKKPHSPVDACPPHRSSEEKENSVHVPIPPSLSDRPPGLGTKPPSLFTSYPAPVQHDSRDSFAPQWWGQETTSSVTLQSKEEEKKSNIALSFDPSSSSSSFHPSSSSWNPISPAWISIPNEEKLTGGLLEENSPRNGPLLPPTHSTSSWVVPNPVVTHESSMWASNGQEPRSVDIKHINRPPPPFEAPQNISSASPLPENVGDNDAHQLFRSLLPNVNVSFHKTSNNQSNANPPPPGIHPREQWNPLAFNSNWQFFSADGGTQQPPHHFSRPPVSQTNPVASFPFWSQRAAQMHQAKGDSTSNPNSLPLPPRSFSSFPEPNTNTVINHQMKMQQQWGAGGGPSPYHSRDFTPKEENNISSSVPSSQQRPFANQFVHQGQPQGYQVQPQPQQSSFLPRSSPFPSTRPNEPSGVWNHPNPSSQSHRGPQSLFPPGTHGGVSGQNAPKRQEGASDVSSQSFQNPFHTNMVPPRHANEGQQQQQQHQNIHPYRPHNINSGGSAFSSLGPSNHSSSTASVLAAELGKEGCRSPKTASRPHGSSTGVSLTPLPPIDSATIPIVSSTTVKQKVNVPPSHKEKSKKKGRKRKNGKPKNTSAGFSISVDPSTCNKISSVNQFPSKEVDADPAVPATSTLKTSASKNRKKSTKLKSNNSTHPAPVVASIGRKKRKKEKEIIVPPSPSSLLSSEHKSLLLVATEAEVEVVEEVEEVEEAQEEILLFDLFSPSMDDLLLVASTDLLSLAEKTLKRSAKEIESLERQLAVTNGEIFRLRHCFSELSTVSISLM